MSPEGTVLTDGFFDIVVRLEIQKSLRLQYPVSLLAIRADTGSPEADDSQLADQLARIVAVVVRTTDVVGRPAVGTLLHVLLVDAHHEHLPAVIARLRLSGCPVAFTSRSAGGAWTRTAPSPRLFSGTLSSLALTSRR